MLFNFLASGLILGALLPLEGDPLAPYRGCPILAIDISAPEGVNTSELRELIDLEPGYILQTDDIQAAIKRLYALGRFSQVGLTAERLSKTVSLHFFLYEIRRLESLEISGTQHADLQALQTALGINLGDEVDGQTQQVLTERATEYLKREGFPAAEVTVELKEDNERRVTAIVRITENQPTKIAAVRFLGWPRISHERLMAQIESRPGKILAVDKLQADRLALQKLYREQGFFDAQVAKPRVIQFNNQTVVVFDIEAGFRVRFVLAGAKLFTAAEILKLWSTAELGGQPNDVKIFAERIAESYRNLGYLEAQVRLKSNTDLAQEEIRYLLEIETGPALRVTAIDFPGATALPVEALRQHVYAYQQRALDSDSFFEKLDSNCDSPKGQAANTAEWDLSGNCDLTRMPVLERYIPSLYLAACEEIAAVYRELGFTEAQVGPPETRREGNLLEVMIPVAEGIQTSIESLGFAGNEAFSSGELLEIVSRSTSAHATAIPQRPGNPLSAAGIEDGRIAILQRYRDLGYLYAQAFSNIEISANKFTAKVSYRLEEGPQVRVRRALLRGNRYTRDSIIKSRLTTNPGDLYRLNQVLADQRAVAALGVFSSVRVKLIDEEVPAEQKDLVTEVNERNRQLVELAAGVSSADGPRLKLQYSNINVFGSAATFIGSAQVNRQIFFNLYGEYQKIMSERYNNFGVTDQIEREFRVGLASPQMRNFPLDPSARIDLIHERDNAISYSLAANSLMLGIDFIPLDKLTIGIEPQFAFTELQCVKDLAVNSEDACIQADVLSGRRFLRRIDVGPRRTFKVGPTITLDLRDNPFNPRQGFFANFKMAQAFGRGQTKPDSTAENDYKFTKFEGTLSGYLPVGRTVLAMSGRAGVIYVPDVDKGNTVPIDERFFMGGRTSLRGFPEGGTLVAQDSCIRYTDSGKNIPYNCSATNSEQITRTATTPPLTNGGEIFLLFKFEARIPLPKSENLSLGLFVDWGNLYVRWPNIDKLRFRLGTGVGLRYATPIGPLALDIAFNPDPDSVRAEPAGPFIHFAVGVF